MSITLKPRLFPLNNVKIVSWADGADSEIAAMVQAADIGLIKLSDYWNVGDERKIHLSAMNAMSPLTDTHVEQDATFILMNKGGVLKSNGEECNFVVGQKLDLKEYGVMNTENTNVGSWGSTPRRTWCNSIFFNALPAPIRNVIKTMKTATIQETGTGSQVVEDKIAFYSIANICASWNEVASLREGRDTSWVYPNIFNIGIPQFEYLKNDTNKQNAVRATLREPVSPSGFMTFEGPYNKDKTINFPSRLYANYLKWISVYFAI